MASMALFAISESMLMDLNFFSTERLSVRAWPHVRVDSGRGVSVRVEAAHSVVFFTSLSALDMP